MLTFQTRACAACGDQASHQCGSWAMGTGGPEQGKHGGLVVEGNIALFALPGDSKTQA